MNDISSIKIEVLSLADCRGTPPTIDLINSVASGLEISIEISQTVIVTAEDAVENRFAGSPTVRVNGLDVEPAMRDVEQSALT